MKYVIKEKFWSWGDDFHIYDENQNPVFFIDGKAFSRGKIRETSSRFKQWTGWSSRSFHKRC